MAGVSSYSPIASADGDERLYAVDDPTGTPADAYITVDVINAAQNADDVSITDSGTYFTGTDVEAALQEVGADLATIDGTLSSDVVLVADTDSSGYGFVVDEDDMSSDSATKLPTQQSVKAYVDAEVAASTPSGVVYETDTDASGWDFVLDEDDMSSDSATMLPTQQSVKAYVDSTALVTINSQTGTTYTALSSDNGKLIVVNNGSAHTLTLPSLTEGTVITVFCQGAGGITFSASGTSFLGSSPSVACAQNEGMQAIYVSSTTIAVIGGTA